MRSDDPAEALRQIAVWADAYPGEKIGQLSDEQLKKAEEVW